MERDLHGGGRLVLNVIEGRLRRVPGAEEGAVNERGDGKVETASHIRPGVDEMETGETVGGVVLHTNTKRSSTTFKIGHLSTLVSIFTRN